MKLGAMNNPQSDLYSEIRFIAEQGFDFLDLTLEPGTSYPEKVNIKKVLKLKERYDLEIIGHTPWNLPFASQYKGVREAAFKEYLKCLRVFKKLDVKLVNLHPYIPDGIGDPGEILKQNIDSIKSIVKAADKLDITVMLENTKSLFNEIPVIAKILEDIPKLKLHWDIGHANLGNEGEKNTKLAFMNFKSKIAHIHISDNKGSDDEHLPIGAGSISWPQVIRILREYKYNRTITLEVHSPDLSYLVFSRDKLKYMLKNFK